eukprot:366131-Chlamydomonas_euryale.AAC.33
MNKTQGQIFPKVGMNWPVPRFSHGQLYVALSRVGSPKGTHLLITHAKLKGQHMEKSAPTTLCTRRF